MPNETVRVGIETTPKKVFASALDWPGWSRAGRDRGAALGALAAAAPRYAAVAATAGIAFEPAAGASFHVEEETEGTATTAFGAPDVRFAADHLPTSEADGARLAALLEAAWSTFDAVVASAPAALRRGPRGGGRERDRIVEHVRDADEGYARVLGIKPGDHDGHDALRRAVLDALRRPSDGSPIAGRRWPARYAARRLAWHALDHAWEIEDRSNPER